MGSYFKRNDKSKINSYKSPYLSDANLPLFVRLNTKLIKQNEEMKYLTVGGPLVILETPSGYNRDRHEIYSLFFKFGHHAGITFKNIALMSFKYYKLKTGFHIFNSTLEHCICYIENGVIFDIIDVKVKDEELSWDVSPMKSTPFDLMVKSLISFINENKYTKTKDVVISVGFECNFDFKEFKNVYKKQLGNQFNVICETPFDFHYGAQQYSISDEYVNDAIQNWEDYQIDEII